MESDRDYSSTCRTEAPARAPAEIFNRINWASALGECLGLPHFGLNVT